MNETELVKAAGTIQKLATRLECANRHRDNVARINAGTRAFVKELSPVGYGITEEEMKTLVYDAVLSGLSAEADLCRTAIQDVARSMSGADEVTNLTKAPASANESEAAQEAF